MIEGREQLRFAPEPGGAVRIEGEPLGQHFQRNDAIQLKIRSSDEDARTVWKMITDQPLQLSLAYIATISPAR